MLCGRAPATRRTYRAALAHLEATLAGHVTALAAIRPADAAPRAWRVALCVYSATADGSSAGNSDIWCTHGRQ